MSLSSTLICPLCSAPLLANQSTCPSCREDLSALARLAFEPGLLYNQGLFAAKAGRLNDALTALEHSTQLDGTFVDTWVVLGKVYAQQGDHSRARAAWQQALKLSPDAGAAQAGLARLDAIEQVDREQLHREQQEANRRPNERPSIITAPSKRKRPQNWQVVIVVLVTFMLGATVSWIGQESISNPPTSLSVSGDRLRATPTAIPTYVAPSNLGEKPTQDR